MPQGVAMPFKSIMGAALCVLLVPCAALAAPAQGARKSAEAIRDCAAANAPQKTLVQALHIETFDGTGGNRRIRAKLFYKRFGPDETRTTLQVRSPPDLSGTSYLLVDTTGDDRLFLYLPSVESTRRVTGGGAAKRMLGTDFSYEDMKQIRAMSEGGDVTRKPATAVAGRKTHTVVLTPGPDEQSAYRRVVFRIDQQTCVPLRIDFFEAGDKPVKRYTAEPESLLQVDGHWLAGEATMRTLGEDTQTRLSVDSAQFDEEVSDTIFNRRTFHLGASGLQPLRPGAA